MTPNLLHDPVSCISRRPLTVTLPITYIRRSHSGREGLRPGILGSWCFPSLKGVSLDLVSPVSDGSRRRSDDGWSEGVGSTPFG